MKTKRIEGTIPDCEDIYKIYKNIAPVDIMINKRIRDIVDYRVFFVKLCLDYTNATTTTIAKFVNRHHASVLHYRKNFEVFCVSNKKAYRDYRIAEQKIIAIFPSASLHSIPEIETDPLDLSRKYIRRYHATKTKLNFFRKYSIKLEEKLKKIREVEKFRKRESNEI